MKATCLRFGIGFLAGAAFLVGAAAIAPRTARADEAALKSALDDYAAGKWEDALKKLRDYVATNPGDDEVYRVLREVDDRLKVRILAQQGEHEILMRRLLDKARVTVEAKKRDPERIKQLVEQAINGDLDARRLAGLELARFSGAYAVPELLPHLGATDAEKVVNAIFAFHYLGSEAVLPLAEALQSSDARLRGYVATVLGDLRDPAALPALRRAAATDADENVRNKAMASINKIRPGAAPMSAAESYVRVGQRYYANSPGAVGDLGDVTSVWRWENDALVRYEVPQALYGFQLAEENAQDAIALEPGNLAARSLLVRSLLAQAAEAEVMKDGAPEPLKGGAPGAWDLAVSQGYDAANAALADALEQHDWDVAVRAARLVGATYGRQDLMGSPLGRALDAPQQRVRYAAAVAALRMSPPGPFENSDKVPTIAAKAAAEVAMRQVFLIDDHDDVRSRMLVDLREAGYNVAHDGDGYRGVERLKTATADVVIVRADLGAAATIPSNRWKSTMAVVDELLLDARTKAMRIVILVGGTAEMAEAQKATFTTMYGDKLAGYVVDNAAAASWLPTVEAAVKKGDMGADRERALKVAADAADAFAVTNSGCGAWDYKVAVEALSSAATDGQTPEIKLNAVRALGNLHVGGAGALATVLKGEGAEDLKVAAAKSLGMVLSRVQGTPEEVDALVAAAKAGGAVGSAAMQSIGMAIGVNPETVRQVYADHRLPVAKKGE
jgi:HEAT repeat protein